MKSGEYEEVKSGSSLLQSAKQSECASFRIETQMRNELHSLKLFTIIGE